MEKELPIETQRFKQVRQEQRLTQQAFAEALDLRGAIADIERGKTRLPGAAVMRLLQLYRINPLWLYGASDRKHLDPEADGISPKVVTLDAEQQENIALVNQRASAGYAHNLQDAEWYEALPAFSLPLPEYRNASFRGFQVSGNSMYPVLHPGEWVIARAEENLRQLAANAVYVVVLSDTIVVKKIVPAATNLHLVSINPEYPEIVVPLAEVREVWRVTAKITAQLEVPQYDLDRLAAEIRQGFDALKLQLKPQE